MHNLYMCICMRTAVHLCIYTDYSEGQNTCLAITNSTCKHYNRLENARNRCAHGYLSDLHLFCSLLAKWHPPQSTKMAVNRLNQVQRPVQAQIQHLQQENMDAVSSTPFKKPYQRRAHSHWQRSCIFLMSCKRKDGVSLKQPSILTLWRATKAG